VKKSLIRTLTLAGALALTWSIGFAQDQVKETLRIDAQAEDAKPIGRPSTTTSNKTNSNIKVEALRSEAYQLYRDKKYASACPKYEAATQLDPTRGDLWADLGICLFNLGNRERAKEAELKAIDRGSKNVRLHAYYGLWKIGVKLPIPQYCTEWSCSREGCAQSLAVCRYNENCLSGTGLSLESSGLGFCLNATDAKAYQLTCNSNNGESCFGIELVSSQQSYCRPGDVGNAPCGACGCEGAPNPKACEEAVAECKKTAVENKLRDCTFVYADAENLKVGAVCDGKAVEIRHNRIARPSQ